MSFYKQLWIAVVFLLSTVFALTFVINGISTRQYLEQQLSLKNDDDAYTLALSLSQQELDPVLLELQLAAKLDQGNYKSIAFIDPNGEILFERENPVLTKSYPDWLTRLFPINPIPGTAEISNGWTLMGSVIVSSNANFAYMELWQAGKRAAVALLIAIIGAGLVGSLVLRLILRPLNAVVEQAEAIGQRRFLQVPEPFTTEFRTLTLSMNDLSIRVKEMLTRESQRLERQREASELDATTGILLRDPFMGRLRAKLTSEGADASGAIALVRLTNLARMNQVYGRGAMDSTLKAMGSSLRRLTMRESSWSAGRLNGADIILLAPEERNPKFVGELLQGLLSDVLKEHDMLDDTTLPGACVEYASGDTITQVMTTLDAALMASDEQGISTITLASRRTGSVVPAREQAMLWQKELIAALSENRFFLELFPVLGTSGKLFHDEGMVRVKVNHEVHSAGMFMPWVHRLDLGGEIDRAVVRMAVQHIQKSGRTTAVNLTTSALTDPTFAIWLEDLLLKRKMEAPRLNLEVTEASAYAHPEGFRRMSQRARATGAKVGVEHMGYRVNEIGKLSELGVDYIKIDGLFTTDLNANPGNSALLKTYVNIAETMGLPCIAEGIRQSKDLRAAFELGVTAASGPAVK